MPQFDNLDLANRLTVLILADCLKSFPSPTSIDWRSIAIRLAKEIEIDGIESITEDYLLRERVPHLRPDRFVSHIQVAGDTRDLRNVIHDMLTWLANEGYIDYEPNFVVQYGADGSEMASLHATPSSATISAKAMAALRRSPEALSTSPTLGDAFRSAAATAGNAGLGELAGSLVKTFLTYTTGIGS